MSGDSGQVDLAKLNERIAQLEKQANEYKAKYTEANSKLENIEQEAANKSGDVAKKLELADKKLKQLEADNAAKTNKILAQNIRSVVSKHAADAHSIDDILHIPEVNEMLRTGIDKESLTLSEDIAKEAVAKAYELRPHFKKTVATETIHTDKPKTTTTNNTDDLSKLSAGEIKAKMLNIGQ